MGAQRLFEITRQTRLFGSDILGSVGIEQRLAQESFDVADADFGQRDGAVFFVDLVIFGLQLLDDLRHLAVPLQVAWAGPEMISGVRASSISTLSTSSTMA